LIVDCDVHNYPASPEALHPYLPAHWREHLEQTVFKGASEPTVYPPNAPTTVRPDARPAEGPPGSSLELLREHLTATGASVAILNCAYAVDSLRHPDAAVAFARAVNDWQIAEWLDRDPRLRASVVVPNQLPEAAAREVERVGDHPGFVQVFLPVRSHHPYGNRLYHPMWEAIARKNLVGGIHFGGAPGNPPTPSGWPSYYYEEYVGMAQVFASQVTSLISEGVFDAFPTLRVALLEGGFTWLPAHLWRLDKEWRYLRRTVPWLKRAPSAYAREHLRLTVQPLDAPPSTADLLRVVDQLGSEEMLMYASDFPHAHAADVESSLLGHLPGPLAGRIRGANAGGLYGL